MIPIIVILMRSFVPCSPVVTLIHKYWQRQPQSLRFLPSQNVEDSPLSHFSFFSRCVNYLGFYPQYKVNRTGGKKTLNEELTCYWREKKVVINLLTV